jgi:hypothetical protein
MHKIWINKSSSFKEAEDFDRRYYLNMTPKERIETVFMLRETHFRIKGIDYEKAGEGLRRILKVIRQASG